MRKFQLKTQLLLGALVAALLPSCATKKNAVSSDSETTEDTLRTEIRDQRVRVLYGIPPEVYQMREERARQEADSLKTNPTDGE